MIQAFPFHEDCYKWPRAGVFTEHGDELRAAELNVHCIYHPIRDQHHFIGFVGVDRDEQIGQVIHLAEEVGRDHPRYRLRRRGHRHLDGTPADNPRVPRRIVLLRAG